MIKKIFLTFFGLFFLNITFCSSDFVVRNFGTYGVSPLVNSYDIAILKNGQFLTQNLGDTKNILMLRNSIYFLWTTDSKLYAVMGRNRDGQYAYFEGYLRKYQICDEVTSSSTTNTNCTTNYITDTSNNVFSNFFNSITNNDFYSLNMSLSTSSYSSVKLCFSSNSIGHSLCFNASITNCNNLDRDPDMDCTNNLGLGIGGFDTINRSFLGNSPGYNGGGNNGGNSGSGDLVGIALSSTGGAIDFYENRVGLNKDICYVGVNSMSTLYGTSGISFNQGGGLTIFDAFQTLYGSTGLNEVYVWINNWLLNYEQWFGNDGNPMFLSNYNSGTNQVDIYYDNLTFPFANNPVAVYFMASYIEQVFANGLYNPSGSAVVSYCNLKINNGTFEEIIDNSDKVSINNYIEKENKYKGLNPDGTEKDYGAWLSSGVEIAFSGNTSIKDTLINFLDETEESIKSLKGNTGSVINGHILPSWLIGAFLFFALFKFIRKR